MKKKLYLCIALRIYVVFIETVSLEYAQEESFKFKDFRIEDDLSGAFICLIVMWSMKACANQTDLYAWSFYISSSYLGSKISKWFVKRQLWNTCILLEF